MHSLEKWKNRYFEISFSILLFSFASPNKLTSWTTVTFCLVLLFTSPKEIGKQLVHNLAYTMLVVYYLYSVIPFFFNSSVSQYNFVEMCLPILLLPLALSTVSYQALVIGDRTKYLSVYALGITISLIVCLSYALYRFWNEFYLFKNGYEPVTSLIGMHPSYFSLFVSFAFIIVLDQLITSFRVFAYNKKILYSLWILFLGFGVFYIRSRTGIISFIVVVLFAIFYKLPYRYKLRSVLAFVFVLVSIYVTVRVTSFHIGRFEFSQIENSIALKGNQWKASMLVIKDHYLFGVTAVDAQNELNNQYSLLGFSEGVENAYNSHNQFLTTLLNGGIIGFLLLFIPLYLVLYRGIHKNDLIAVSFVLLIILAFMTESMLARHKGLIFYTGFLTILLLPKGKFK